MLQTTVIFILTLLILVVIHEFGHFLMAKRFGIKVLEFGFGIPPRIFGKKIGDTIYSLNWLPIGGFVRLLGEDEVGALTINKGSEKSGDFRAKPVGQRIIVVIAGVVMNLFLAWILFYTVLTFKDFKIIYPTSDPVVVVQEVEAGFPAQSAGIKSGDRILAVDSKLTNSIEEARNLIKSKAGSSVKLSLGDIDGNFIKEVSVAPKKVSNTESLIGVVFSPIGFKQYNTPIEKIFSGITYSYDLTKLTSTGLIKLFQDVFSGNFHKVSQSVSGPVGLATVTNNILSTGSQAVILYIWFVGVISLTLAIFNVLPFPALDGGRLLFLYIEAITRKKVSPKVETMVHSIGMAILLTLTLLVTISDIKKLF